jgi:hypothetical protein
MIDRILVIFCCSQPGLEILRGSWRIRVQTVEFGQFYWCILKIGCVVPSIILVMSQPTQLSLGEIDFLEYLEIQGLCSLADTFKLQLTSRAIF